jgi:3'-phosphoadenosine 5'-phosphosulfate sulfotransferase (PAPS reductase)/FAD synthetase
MNIQPYLDEAERKCNFTIFDSFVKAKQILSNSLTPVCSVSGGADSDLVVDILSRIDTEKQVKYVFFDTGIEYEATKKHLDFLESKYGIKIERIRAITPVPLGCRKFGLPFWSKHASEMIERLQRYDFKWEDKPFDELIKEYPKCRAALRWWCNDFAEKTGKSGKIIKSKFNINYINLLKEYMIANPPRFNISPKCCEGAKKNNAKAFLKEAQADLNILGIRKAEGGIRSAAYRSCFDASGSDEPSKYRPLFWYTDTDKTEYEELFNVTHSACYCEYGLKRTGCAGCPFGKDFENELEIIAEHEPKLYKAVNNIFGESYEYTRGFLKFREEQKEKKQNDLDK